MTLSACPFCGGPNAGGMHPHLNTCPWQLGKLDVECASCGTKEAASAQCSACLHDHTPDEYRPHTDPRALHYRASGPPARQEPPIEAIQTIAPAPEANMTPQRLTA